MHNKTIAGNKFKYVRNQKYTILLLLYYSKLDVAFSEILPTRAYENKNCRR